MTRPETPSQRSSLAPADLGLPQIFHDSLAELQLADAPRRGQHTVAVGPDGISLDFFAQIQPADVLYVALHGANTPASNFYPRFERIRSLSRKVEALVCFADPTIQVSKELRLSWYAGTRDWDPKPWLLEAAGKAQRAVGARHVVFLGGSGGGFAALRLAHAHPAAAAFVQAPQTAIRRYSRGPVHRYLRHAWGECADEHVLTSDPTRFDVGFLYAQRSSRAAVYYLQSRGDPVHVQRHLEPFRSECSRSPLGRDLDSRLRLIEYDSERPGHGPPSPGEFDHHFARAREFFEERWRWQAQAETAA